MKQYLKQMKVLCLIITASKYWQYIEKLLACVWIAVVASCSVFQTVVSCWIICSACRIDL